MKLARTIAAATLFLATSMANALTLAPYRAAVLTPRSPNLPTAARNH